MENATVDTTIETLKEQTEALEAISDVNAKAAQSFVFPDWDGLRDQLATLVHDEYAAQVTAEANLTKGQFIALIVDMIKSGEFVRIVNAEVSVDKTTQAITYQPLVELLRVRAERDAMAKQLNDIKAVFSVMN